MNKYLYTIGASILALTMSGLPAIVRAESGDNEGQGGVGTKVNVTAQGTEVSAGVSARVGGKEQSSLGQQRGESKGQEEQVGTTSSDDQMNSQEMSNDQNIEENQDGIHFDLEGEGDMATSFHDLEQKIEKRKHELEQEVASTTLEHEDIVEHANSVRLAVHSLLASKKLLGGIGPQVSEITKEMNDSVATTTNAEVQIQSRGFLMRLLFGGDMTAADVIAQQVTQNQQRIDVLTSLLGAVNISADIQATIQAQIVALREAQTRLQDLAQKEQKLWGLFSWRF